MKANRGFARILAMVLTIAAAGIIGGAGTGHAATTFQITLEPQIGTTGNWRMGRMRELAVG